jgi:N-acetylglucosamine-6-phosphate deacetylase
VIEITGAAVVLPDRVLDPGRILIDGERITEVAPDTGGSRGTLHLPQHTVVPGFVDVHVHGVEGSDTLDGAGAVGRIAARLPCFGVTAFCPTSVACAPDALRELLSEIRDQRAKPDPNSSRVLPAHLESNFINPEYRGAQPIKCLRVPDEHRGAVAWPFTGSQILEIIGSSRSSIGIVTLAPELPGCIDLTRALVAAGHVVSLGHSGANFETAIEAIEAGATHATHLFNRMTPIAHRAPGLVGAVLARHEVSAELICDGYHVHPAICGVAIAAKGPSRIMAISDGTSGSGLPVGSIGRLGGQSIHVRESAAFLDDGTLAGSTLTMDRGFRNLVTTMRQSIVDAALMCSTTPANQLGLSELGRISEGAQADITLLARDFQVVRTFVGGEQVWPA